MAMQYIKQNDPIRGESASLDWPCGGERTRLEHRIAIAGNHGLKWETFRKCFELIAATLFRCEVVNVRDASWNWCSPSVFVLEAISFAFSFDAVSLISMSAGLIFIDGKYLGREVTGEST